MSAQSQMAPATGAVTTASILLVEDNLVIQKLVGFMVKTKGLFLDVVSNGVEALQKLKAKKYDLVLMDIEMPLMNGLDCTRQMRQQHLETPVIALTAHESPEDIQSCIDAGMNDHLKKPFDARQFQEVLHRHLKP